MSRFPTWRRISLTKSVIRPKPDFDHESESLEGHAFDWQWLTHQVPRVRLVCFDETAQIDEGIARTLRLLF